MQELNRAAIEFLEQGDTQSAQETLQLIQRIYGRRSGFGAEDHQVVLALPEREELDRESFLTETFNKTRAATELGISFLTLTTTVEKMRSKYEGLDAQKGADDRELLFTGEQLLYVATFRSKVDKPHPLMLKYGPLLPTPKEKRRK